MNASPRLLVILFIALLTLSAGCSSSGRQADSKDHLAPITPKPYNDEVASDKTSPRGGDAYYGGYYERHGIGSSFDASGWTADELKAASFIHGSNIYFHFDSALLTTDAKEVLRQKAARLKAFPQLRVLIAGHSDERGKDDYNLSLGERRAKAAGDYLISLGVPSSQLGTVSFGKRFPVASGTDEKSWSKNRRDEFLVSKP